jgi:hypothetical protein
VTAEPASRPTVGLGDPPQPTRKFALLEGVDAVHLPALGEALQEGLVEEVDGEAAVFVDAVAVVDAFPVVGVAGVADGVDEEAARA